MRRRIRSLSVLAAVWTAAISLADEPPAPNRTPNGREKSAAAAQISDPLLDIRYLLGDDGQPILVPDKASLRGYLNWLERERTGQQAPIPYSVTSITCSGTVEDDVAQLKVVVRIRTTTNDWVLVPMQMGEGTLREEPAYEGPGVTPLQLAFQQETGYAWWFKGNKSDQREHVLTLQLSVPVRKQAPMRRLQLSLPATAVSSLRLRVRNARVTNPRSSEKSRVSVKSVGKESEIEVIGLGPRMDVAWQTAPELTSIDTTLEVATSVTATLAPAERTATLFATQTIRSVGQQGTFDEVRVKLPTGGELLQVDSSEFQDYQIDSADPKTVVVKLQRQIGGPFDLRWTIRVPLPAEGESFVIDGFDVERARIHSGFLAVAIVGDFRLSPVTVSGKTDPREGTSQRINLDALPLTLRQARTAVAYRFENRLRLTFAVRRVESSVIVSPEAWVEIDQEIVSFAATYDLQVLRGSIPEISFRWPGWKEGGWIVERLEASESTILPQLQEATNVDELRVEFNEPAQKRFKLTIWARRLLEPGWRTTTFALPIAQTSASSTARMAVLTPQNIQLDLQPIDGTVIRTHTDQASRIAVPRDLQKLHRDEYRIESAEARFQAEIKVHPRKILASTVVSASQERPGMAVVRQRVAFNVEYGSIPDLRFAVPPGLKPEQLMVADVEGNELKTQWNGESPESEMRILLGPPRSGHLELDLQYSLAVSVRQTPETDRSMTISLLTPGDTTFSSTQFQWRDSQGRDATVHGEDWTRFADPNGQWAWRLPRQTSEIKLTLGQGAGAWRESTVSRALIRTVLGADGSIRTRAEYRFNGAVAELLVGIPENVQLESFLWDGKEVRPIPAQVDTQGASLYRIAPERNTGTTSVLAITTTASAAAPPRFAGTSLIAAPTLPDNLPVRECQWQLTLPGTRHLFTVPEGYAPAYQWKQSGVFWKRRPDRTTAELEEWLGAAYRTDEADALPEGNIYLFSRFGAPEPLQFRTMSQSGVVLVGAGLALTFGWVLVHWPVTRHILTFLFGGFCAAMAAVWYAEPVLLLLQPAVLGLLLAAVAAVVDNYSKRRRQPIGVPLNPTSGYILPVSSVARGAIQSIGSNEFTSDRHPVVELAPGPVEPAGQLSETGSRA